MTNQVFISEDGHVMAIGSEDGSSWVTVTSIELKAAIAKVMKFAHWQVDLSRKES